MPNIVIGQDETPPGYLKPREVAENLSDGDSDKVYAVFYEDKDEIGILSNVSGTYYLTSLTGYLIQKDWTFNSLFTAIQDAGGTLKVFEDQREFADGIAFKFNL